MTRPVLVILLALMSFSAVAQDKPQTTPERKNPVWVSPSARLAAAKTVYMKNAAGSDVPFNVISGGIEGWGRFELVDAESKADIVVSVYSPDDERSSKDKTRVASMSGGVPDSPPPSNTDGPIRMVVSDAHTHLPLWSATEQPKGGLRQRAQDQHMVEAAQHLLVKFHDRLEPAAKP